MKRSDEAIGEVQELYARWLDVGTHVAYAASLCGLLLYLSGALPAFVPMEKLPEVWSLPVAEYLARTGAPAGWGWIGLVRYSDYLNFAGIALFASVSALCCLVCVPAFLRRGERLHAFIAAMQVTVLVAVATGWFAGGP